MRPGSAQADAAYDKAFNREADKYFAPAKLYCQACEEVLTEDEGNGGENQHCTECQKLGSEE